MLSSMKYQKQKRIRSLAKVLSLPSAVLLVVLVLCLAKIQKRESTLWEPTPAMAGDAGQLSRPDPKEIELAHSMQLLRKHPAVHTLQVGGSSGPLQHCGQQRPTDHWPACRSQYTFVHAEALEHGCTTHHYVIVAFLIVNKEQTDQQTEGRCCAGKCRASQAAKGDAALPQHTGSSCQQ
jgi:hypothetical protein